MQHLSGKKLGLLVSVGPESPVFDHAIQLAKAGLRHAVKVYWYSVDEGVRGVADSRLQELKSNGLHLFACALGAQTRNLPITDAAHYSGLGMVSDLMQGTDRFLHFG